MAREVTLQSSTTRRALVGLALAGVAAALVWWRLSGPSETRPAGLLRPDDAALLQRGEALYRAHCAGCHGAGLQGQANWRERGADGRLPAPPHDATGHTWHHPDEVLLEITKNGVARAAGLPDYETNMPAYGGTLSDDDIVAVLSWIKSRWTAETRRLHDEVNRQARPRAPGGS